LIYESRYADLIILGYQAFFSNVAGEASILKDVLIEAECPVMIVPDQYKPIQNILLTFDGKAHSVFAIKQFIQLLPEESLHATATLVHISKSKEEKNHQINQLQKFQQQHEEKREDALKRLKKAATEGENIFKELMETVKVASLGEITRALYECGGQYRRNM